MNTELRQPYNIFPLIERLREHGASMSADERARLKSAIAINAADRRAVAFLADLSGDDWAHIYPAVEPEAQISTGDAISTFLDRYGHTSPEEDALLERLIFNPVPDYGSVLEHEEKADESRPLPSDHDTAALAGIAASINAVPQTEASKPIKEELKPLNEEPKPLKEESKIEPVPAEAPRRRPAAPPLSLELAKIFIKQRQYDRAYDIISKISLNNPEKSVYFADQLRFLEKLIKIQQASAKA